MKILIVEDNEIFAESLKQFLEREGFAVDYVLDGAKGLLRIQLSHAEYDLVILDWMLPQKDGPQILAEIRASKINIPVLMLTARNAVDDKVEGFGKGADDYLAKEPFYPAELLARVKALLRRPREALPAKLQAGPLALDPVSRKVTRDGKEIKLTLREFALLEYLMRNPDRAINREQIWDHVWDFAANAMSNAVDVHIHNLRKKLGQEGGKLLETIPGIGYKLNFSK